MTEFFYFASEIKALLTALPARMRTDMVADYLTFLWVPDPDTLFDGDLQARPGAYCDRRRREAEPSSSTGT